jgi:hypothetical protein
MYLRVAQKKISEVFIDANLKRSKGAFKLIVTAEIQRIAIRKFHLSLILFFFLFCFRFSASKSTSRSATSGWFLITF